jgi:hypothetical protein
MYLYIVDFKHFSYQALGIIISPQIDVVLDIHNNFVQPKKWKGFTQKS